jgi:signal transduction histidine kinase
VIRRAQQSDEQRVLIMAPFGRDAHLAEVTLQRAGVPARAVPSVDALVEGVLQGAGLVIIAGESLSIASMKQLSDALNAQEPWSELPVIVLVTDAITRVRPYGPALTFEELGNVTFLPRPFSRETFLGIVRFALRSRMRQYAMRDLHRQLDGKVEELGRSNKEFEAFAYSAAHDMREPIRVIESYLSLVAERFAPALGGTGTRFIATASAAAARMRALLEALLAYAHVGNGELMSTPVSLRSVASAAVKNLSAAIAAKEAEVIVDGDDCEIMGDGALLTQLFQNLVGNAIKFQRPEAAPKVRLTWRRQADGCTCAVSDNGIGIPLADQGRIFEIFQRLNGASEYPGSGIGLATCRRIVDRHGGRIWVESEEGRGATFHVFIPGDATCHAGDEDPPT